MSVLSNGPFSYNRFDGVGVSDTVNSAYRSIYEKKAKPDFLDMDKDGDKKEPFKKAVNDKKKGCSECEGDCKCDDKKMKNEAANQIDELHVGRHGQSEKEYQDSRSAAGKMISGDSKGSGANYSYRAKNTGPNPAGGSMKPQGQARMNNKDREYLKMQKANMRKEEVNQIDEVAPLAALAPLAGKAAAGLAGKAATAGAAKAGGGIAKAAGSKLGQKAINYGSQAVGNKVTSSLSKSKNEEFTKDDVIEYLVNEGFANNPVSAEVLLTHMSDEWLAHIEEAYQTMSPKATTMSNRRSAKLQSQEDSAAREGNSKKTNDLFQKKLKVMDARGRHGQPGMRDKG